MDTSFIEDLPRGPLDHYRSQANFDWKKLKLVFEEPDFLKVKVSFIYLSIYYYYLLRFLSMSINSNDMHILFKFNIKIEVIKEVKIALFCHHPKRNHAFRKE